MSLKSKTKTTAANRKLCGSNSNLLCIKQHIITNWVVG